MENVKAEQRLNENSNERQEQSEENHHTEMSSNIDPQRSAEVMAAVSVPFDVRLVPE